MRKLSDNKRCCKTFKHKKEHDKYMMFWQRHVLINECKLLMQLLLFWVNMAQKRSTKGKRFGSVPATIIIFCDWKGLRERKPRKNGWEPGMLGQKEGGLGPCPPCSIEMSRVLSEKIQKHPFRAPESFLWSWLKFIFFIFSPSRVIATCTPVLTWVPKKMLQTGAHQLKRATSILSLCSL